MSETKLTLEVLKDTFGICKLDTKQIMPNWAYQGEFFSITKTADELSIVCLVKDIPGEILCETGWKAFKILGMLDFSLVGILAAITTTLAKAGVGIFAISTYNTDYILVKEKDLHCAVSALRNEGHTIKASIHC